MSPWGTRRTCLCSGSAATIGNEPPKCHQTRGSELWTLPELHYFFSLYLAISSLQGVKKQKHQGGTSAGETLQHLVQELGFPWHQEVALGTSDSSACPLGVWEHVAGQTQSPAFPCQPRERGWTPQKPQAAAREQQPLLGTDSEAPQRFRGLFHTAGGTQTGTKTVQSLDIDTKSCPKVLRGSAGWAGLVCTRVR